jgi:hypothetical protein
MERLSQSWPLMGHSGATQKSQEEGEQYPGSKQ